MDDEDEYDDEDIKLTLHEREQALRELFGGGEGMTVEEMEASIARFWEEFLAEEAASRPGNVQTTTMEDLDLQPRQEFMYLFDYGDEWRFKVRVHALNKNANPQAEYPRIVESVGKAPPQYHTWSEE